MDNRLTLEVKKLAYSLGADLVGIANIERYAGAPIKMSPKGILPCARSVVVCAVHHPDAAIELDGEIHPQVQGPYRIQCVMNDKLDVLAFKIARMLDDLGYKTVPIASSNIWRYRGYKEMDAVFAPDMSHIYSAVCAGLGELGWNGLCITPEYGARNRFISIITEAELTPTPLYNGEKICDMCGECIRHCPTDAYRKEVNGKNDVVIEGKHHYFANKNLWRCAWGEHFELDLDLPIPDKVDEEVLLQNIKEHGTRGGEFGVCLKVCLPKQLRQPDDTYCKISMRRKRHSVPTDLTLHRGMYDTILTHAHAWDLDGVYFFSAETLKNAGIDITAALPDGKSAILLNAGSSGTADKPAADFTGTVKQANVDNVIQIARFNADFTELDVCRELENVGYSALPKCTLSHLPFRELAGLGEDAVTSLVLTSAAVEDKAYTDLNATELIRNDLRLTLSELARSKGADLFGVASAETIDSLADQLRVIRKDETIISAADNNPRMMPFDPVTYTEKRVITGANDLLPGAKSVIVMGIHYPETPVARVGQPPAESVGPYVFTQYEVNRLIGHLGHSVVKALNALGYRALYTHNLTGAGSVVGSPRGPFDDAACNALEAVAAGIGTITLNGCVDTEEYGIHQRFIAVVTDAPLEADEVKAGMSEACADCGICLKACPTCALCEKNMVELSLNGKTVPYLPVDANRCDWATKYALVAEEGNMYTGNFTDIPYPEELTEEKLADALRQQDNVFKFRPVMGERCIVTCPLIK